MSTRTYPKKLFDMAVRRPKVKVLAIEGAIRGVIRPTGGGVFVAWGDVGAFPEAVEKLAYGPGLRSTMGDAARRYCLQHFDRAGHARAFNAVLTGASGS